MTDTFAKTLALLDDIANRISTTDAYQRGQIMERAKIVAWLRDRQAVSAFYIDHIEAGLAADCIEAGEHLK